MLVRTFLKSLNTIQVDILKHRAEVPYAVSEAITDDDECQYQRPVVEEACYVLWALMEGREVTEEEYALYPECMYRDILQELIEGSTYFAMWDQVLDTGNKQERLAMHAKLRCCKLLVPRVQEFLGRIVQPAHEMREFLD